MKVDIKLNRQKITNKNKLSPPKSKEGGKKRAKDIFSCTFAYKIKKSEHWSHFYERISKQINQSISLSVYLHNEYILTDWDTNIDLD